MTNGVSNMQNLCGTSSCNAIRCWKWDVNQITSTVKAIKYKYAVLILNRPLTQRTEFLHDLWNNASIRMTIDGGTIQWDKYITSMSAEQQNSIKLPDLISGDFDSITEEILKKYKQKGCKIINTPDQDYTDFTKALMELKTYCTEHELQMDHVVAIGQCSGRFDQILGNIQTLFLAKQNGIPSPNTKVYLMADDSLSWLLSPGDHVINIPEETSKHRKAWCSLVPVGETCQSVTSSGLKWNLDKQPLKFGELVSTSNTFDGSELVKIKCSHTILWSMRVPSVSGT